MQGSELEVGDASFRC